MGAFISFLLGLIPGVGPLLGAASGVITTLWKPATSIASAVAADAEGAIKTVLANTALREALLVGVLVFLFMHEQGVIKGLKWQLADPATGAPWSTEARSLLASYNQERASLLAVNTGLTDQNAAVRALGAASAAKLKLAVPLAQAANTDLRRGLQAQLAILAADKGADACTRAQSVDAAFLEHLP